ncbi:MAG: hypothetical protein KFF77_08920 [Bacteroidetes bacterium]|nr:hypothetical protein [Bacteroidota bacterium]
MVHSVPVLLARTFPVLALFFLATISLVAQTADRSMRCDVFGPDSVFFDKVDFNRYLPGTFTIDLKVVHNGSAAIDSVVAFPRSNQRFTVIAPASRLLTARMQPGDTLQTDFTLQVNPRSESGLDTITVAVSGKEGARTERSWIIWVEKEYRPVNEVLCPDPGNITVAFIDTLNAYVATPMVFPVSVINRGDAPSKETRLFYVATGGVSPALGQELVLDLGTIAPGERVDRVFLIDAVRRNNDTTVFPAFKAQGRGGLGDRLYDTLCSYTLDIPPVREVFFELECESDPQIRFVDGKYIPNPFSWDVRVRNSGNSRAKNVRAVISLPVAYVLEGGSNELFIGDLAPGEERAFSWTVRARPVSVADSSEICVRVFDSFNRTAVCCDSLILPASRAPDLLASCLVVPDTVRVDPQTGLYQPAAFTVDVDVQNLGSDGADSVWAEIIIADPDIRFMLPTGARQHVADRLEASDVARVQWRLAPLPVALPRDLILQVRVTSRNSATATTSCSVYIHAALAPELACEASTIPDDTLHFSTATLLHDELWFTATVHNRGSIAARDLQATILLPPDISIRAQESAVLYRTDPLEVDSSWTVRWRLLPVKKREGSLDTIRVEFRSAGLTTYCGDWIFIIGIPPVTVFTIPRDVVERYNREFTMPILVDESENKDIHEIELFVTYDETKIDFLAWETDGTLLEQGWTIGARGGDGRISFRAFNDTASLQGIGELIRMRYRVRFGDGADILNVSSSPLEFDSLSSSVNRGGILARYYNGDVVVSGDCLYPLKATRNYVSLRNAPNPFNPSTQLQLVLPYDGHVSIVVHDALGRQVAHPQDGVLRQGSHHILFDGSDLPSGPYHAILRIDGGVATIHRMLLLR